MRTAIEQSFIDDIIEAKYGIERPEQDPNDVATEMAAGTEPAGAQPMTLGEFATSAADVPAAMLKGGLQSSAGIWGDLIAVGRGIAAALNPSEGEDRVDAFLRGVDLPTGLPTTEDVSKFLDNVLGPVVPASVTDERRREAAKTPEAIGELVGAGKAIKEAARGAAKTMKRGKTKEAE